MDILKAELISDRKHEVNREKVLSADVFITRLFACEICVNSSYDKHKNIPTFPIVSGLAEK